MKKIYYVNILMLVLTFTFTLLFAQPDDILLNNEKAFGVKERPPVAFPHSLHMESDLECTDCHHRYREGKNVLDEDTLEEGRAGIKCADCHERENRYNLREAFHLQCMGCHGRLKKEGKETGPRLCGECHPRK